MKATLQEALETDYEMICDLDVDMARDLYNYGNEDIFHNINERAQMLVQKGYKLPLNSLQFLFYHRETDKTAPF